MAEKDLIVFVDRVRFLASGQDDPQSVTLDACANTIERLHLALQSCWECAAGPDIFPDTATCLGTIVEIASGALENPPETHGGCDNGKMDQKLQAEIWSFVKDSRDALLAAQRECDRANTLLKLMHAAGLDSHLPTLEEVRAAGPYVRVGWGETLEEASARAQEEGTKRGEDDG